MEEEKHLSQKYYARRLKANKMKRQISNKKRLLRNLRILTRLFIISFIIFLGIFILKLPQWHINQTNLAKGDENTIIVQGNYITPKYKITDVVRQAQLPDIGIYRINTRQLENSIKQLEPIKSVYIRRFWLPSRLVIVVFERKPVFLIAPTPNATPVSALTDDGVFISRDYLGIINKTGTTRILGNGISGSDYYEWDKHKVEELLKLVKAVEVYSGEKVKYIDMRAPSDIFVKLESINLRVGALNKTTQKRIRSLATILPEVRQEVPNIEYIDLRWENARYIKLKGAQRQTSDSDEATE